MKKILAVLGFLLQFYGILVLISAFLALFINETNASISFFITSSISLALGFILNALCERKELNLKESLILLFLTFLLIPLIGSIPYIWLNVFQADILNSFVNGFFESVSSVTTTGFTLIQDFSKIPTSLKVYRMISQFSGGIGIVFIFLVFLYPESYLERFQKVFGLKEKLGHIKRSFLAILSIYLSLVIILFILFFVLGIEKFSTLDIFSYIISGISTSSLLSSSEFTNLIASFPLPILILPMLLGSINVKIYLDLFLQKRIRKFLALEFIIFLIILSITSSLLFFVDKLSFKESIIHSLSLSSTTGFPLNFSQISELSKYWIVIAMFIGGMSLSTAGGFKVFKLISIFSSFKKLVRSYLFGKEVMNDIESISILIFSLSIFLISLSILFLTFQGYTLENSLIETISAFSNVGISTGIILTSNILTKFWFIFLMILGRIEVLPLLALFVKEEKEEKIDHKKIEVLKEEKISEI